MSQYIEFFDDRGMLGPHGMNDILYTTEFSTLTKETPNEISQDSAQHLIDYHYFLGRFLLNSDRTSPISHDNYTGLVCLSMIHELQFHKNMRFGHHCWHPRDLFFYMWLTKGFWHWIGLLFLWVTSICMIESVLNTTFKTINGVDVLETDGKLLTWLCLNSTNVPITKWICDRIAKKKFGGYSQFFEIYFGKSHPNYQLISSKEQV